MTPNELAAQRRREWLAWRRDGIGASDIAAIVHEVYGGQYAVVADKLGHDTDLGDNQAEKDRGHAWEERIADAVQALYGMYVVGEQFPGIHRHHPHHRATLDGLLVHELDENGHGSLADAVAVLEIKTVHEFADMHWDRWATQTRWQMHVANVDRALIVAVKVETDDDGNERFGGMYPRWVERDHDLEHDLVSLADETWTHVQDGVLPDPDCASALDYVNKLTSIADAACTEVVDLEDIGHAVRRFGEIKQAIKAAENERKTLEAAIKARMGSATKGTASGWKISYSKNSNVLDDLGQEAVLLAHPELGKTVLDTDRAKAVLGKDLDAFRSPIGARRLTITPPKETL